MSRKICLISQTSNEVYPVLPARLMLLQYDKVLVHISVILELSLAFLVDAIRRLQARLRVLDCHNRRRYQVDIFVCSIMFCFMLSRRARSGWSTPIG